MIPLLDLAPCPDLLQEGHGGLEDVGTAGKQGLQLLQVSKLTLRIEPSVSQAPADESPVLALHVAVVVPPVGTGTGEANPMSSTEPSQFIIDELAAIIRVQELDWERQVREDTGERIEDVTLCTAGDRDDCGPSRTAVRDREGVAVVSCFLPSIVAHEVHLHRAWSSSREFPG